MTWETKTQCCFVRVWGCVLSLSALRVDWSMLRMIHLICCKLQDSYINPHAFLKSKIPRNKNPPKTKKKHKHLAFSLLFPIHLIQVITCKQNPTTNPVLRSPITSVHFNGPMSTGLSWVLDASDWTLVSRWVFDKQMRIGDSRKLGSLKLKQQKTVGYGLSVASFMVNLLSES